MFQKIYYELQSYFTGRVNKILTSKNKKLIGWDEILDGGLNENVAVMNRFDERGAIEQAKTWTQHYYGAAGMTACILTMHRVDRI